MFASSYQQGCLGVSIFNPNGKDPLRLLKYQACERVYDREVKGYLLGIEGAISYAAMDNLGIIQSLLCFQMCPHPQKHTSFEVIILDQHANRRRFHFSTKFRAPTSVGTTLGAKAMMPMKKSPDILHCQLPLITSPGAWTTIIIDLPSLTSNCFKGAIYSGLEAFTVLCHCRLRKIFSLPHPGQVEMGMLSGNQQMIIPADFDFPLGIANEQLSIDSALYFEKDRLKILSNASNISSQSNVSPPIVAQKPKVTTKQREKGAKVYSSPGANRGRMIAHQSPAQLSHLESLVVEEVQLTSIQREHNLPPHPPPSFSTASETKNPLTTHVSLTYTSTTTVSSPSHTFTPSHCPPNAAAFCLDTQSIESMSIAELQDHFSFLIISIEEEKRKMHE